jgi:hypothetical protein
MASDLARLSSADSRSTSWRCRSFEERSRIKDSHYPRKALPRCRAPARWDHPSASDMGPALGVINVGDEMIAGLRVQGQEARCPW